jgi:hypothetical protein
MPGINGVELGWVVNELSPIVNVLYVSRSSRETVGDRLPTDCALLPKPSAPDALANAAGSALVRGHGASQFDPMRQAGILGQ